MISIIGGTSDRSRQGERSGWLGLSLYVIRIVATAGLFSKRSFRQRRGLSASLSLLSHVVLPLLWLLSHMALHLLDSSLMQHSLSSTSSLMQRYLSLASTAISCHNVIISCCMTTCISYQITNGLTMNNEDLDTNLSIQCEHLQ